MKRGVEATSAKNSSIKVDWAFLRLKSELKSPATAIMGEGESEMWVERSSMADIRVGETWVDELVSQGKWQLTIVVALLKRVIT